MTQPLKQSLSGEWQFRQAGSGRMATRSPSPVASTPTCCARAASMTPLWATRKLRVQWVAQQDWEYRRTSSLTADLLSHDRVQLVCDGLDTLATVSLNGQRARRGRQDVPPCIAGMSAMLSAPAKTNCRSPSLPPLSMQPSRNKIRPLPDVNNALPGRAPTFAKLPATSVGTGVLTFRRSASGATSAWNLLHRPAGRCCPCASTMTRARYA